MIPSAEKYRQVHANKSMARKTESYRVANTGMNWHPRSPKSRLPNRPTSPCKSSPNKTYPKGSSGSRKQRDEVLRRTKRELICFACNEIGHFARERPHVRRKDKAETSTSLITSVSILDREEMDRLSLYSGYIRDKPITVITDTGATTVGIRASLVRQSEYTGQSQSCIKFGGNTEVFSVAEVQVDTITICRRVRQGSCSSFLVNMNAISAPVLSTWGTQPG